MHDIIIEIRRVRRMEWGLSDRKQIIWLKVILCLIGLEAESLVNLGINYLIVYEFISKRRL